MEIMSSSSSEDFSDTIFWFLHENSDLSSSSSSEWPAADDHDDFFDDSDHDNKAAFWQDQQQLLQAILCRTTPTESRVRQATEEALRGSAPPCQTDISERLRLAGFQCSIRTSKWKKTSKIPSGKHTYLEVVEERKKRRVIVELNLRAEFEMARAGVQYDRLVSLLPEVYVGKAERLRDLVSLLCGAAKKSAKQNNIHLPPWRKLNYMQSKWFSASTTCDDPPQEAIAAPAVSNDRSSRPARASMLTFALLRNLPAPHRQPAVTVV